MGEKLEIEAWMKRDVVAIHPAASVKEAAALLVDRKVGTLPVVDEDGVLIGMTSITAGALSSIHCSACWGLNCDCPRRRRLKMKVWGERGVARQGRTIAAT